MKYLIPTILLFFSCNLSIGQKRSNITSITGHPGPSFISISIVNPHHQKIKFVYYQKNNPGPKNRIKNKSKSESIILELSGLEPNTEYYYLIKSGLFQNLTGKFKTQPILSQKDTIWNFTIAAGSCAYLSDNNAGDSSLKVFNSIKELDPDLMIWLGDNIYLRNGEWLSKAAIWNRYLSSLDKEEIKNLLSNVPNLAIFDDHDFGPNDAVGTWPLSHISKKIFKNVWPNPDCKIENTDLTTFVSNHMGVDIIGLDGRTQRTYPREDGQMFGKYQIDWLVDYLENSKSRYKIVLSGSQVLSDLSKWENFARYTLEKNYLLEKIKEKKINGVIFLSGDRHHSEISKVILDGNLVVWDITTSPLTSKTSSSDEGEKNTNRVDGSLHKVKGFATLHFSRKGSRTHVGVEFRDALGQVYYKYFLE